MLELINGQINPYVGVVEGFYWPTGDAVNGQSGSYSATQRNQLIQLLASNGLGVYWYAAQPPVDTMALWSAAELAQWTKTQSFATQVGVKLVYGLRPGWLGTDYSAIVTRLTQIQSAGIRFYSLNFDDAEGVQTSQQQTREVQLVSYLNTTLPNMKLWGLTPSYYYQETTRTAWNTNLQTIDGIASTVPMIFTGETITPSTFSSAQFPTLSSGRSKVFWDNWIAVDTSARIPWGMISGRTQNNIFTSPYGYILNLAYPLERVVHHIYCLGKLSAAAGSSPTLPSCSVPQAAAYWASWLSYNGFLHSSTQTVATVTSGLSTAISADAYYTNIAQFESANPSLSGQAFIFLQRHRA
ncbi:hyaluronidase [Cavenderia fasciculata]|uniref:Hyaluronidase n=1 Tax=Cavenderia fasciculata TaxID=261658 RepID=F4PNX6_CACFS|nr:hyaluronidase [Cavenderia fasciculata]EGG23179.1 hyaluronidase [Cavenderia fasciculata]|eukprot:XP_004361030.1 hyaluronidase [Cavenderia fasciculata]